MQSGFPAALLAFLRCPADAGELRLQEPAAGGWISNATLRCAACGCAHHIADGMLSLRSADLHPESAHEQRQRDARNARVLDGTRPEWRSPFADATEVTPTLDALDVSPGMRVLELGCGSGRYTVAIAAQASAVVAVDFSRAGLEVLRGKLDREANVALVQADVTRPYAAPGTFDRVLSTLHSNLPGAEQRSASLRHAAAALKPDGRAVISMHHHSTRNILLGIPADGRYADSGIYRYYMRQREAQEEARPFFRHVRFVHAATRIPGVRSARIARVAGRIPVIRSMFGDLFLAVSEGPRGAAHTP